MHLVRNIFIVIFTLLIFQSCDKQKKTGRNLEGEWEINYYKLTDIEGLNEYATVSGSMVFDANSDVAEPIPYSININYVFPDFTGSTDQHGTANIIEKGDYMDVTTIDSNNLVTSNYKYRILALTNTDLQLEFTDTTSHIHTYILKKKK